MKFSEILGNAKFVCPSEKCVSPVFTGNFSVTGSGVTVMTVCIPEIYRLYINGRQVNEDFLSPATSFYHRYDDCFCGKQFGEEMKSRIYCMRYDITALVREGTNEFSAITAPGWYALYSDKCVFACKITGAADYESGTDITWCPSPIKEYSFNRGEKHDYDTCGYPALNTAETCLPETEYCIQTCPNDRIIRSAEFRTIMAADEYSIIDCGENITGRYVFRCPQKGRRIAVTVSEDIDENKELDEKHIHNQTSEFVCDGTDREYAMLLDWQAFRYIKLPAGCELLRVEVIHCDIAQSSYFKCGNTVLNGIYDMYIRTQLCNMHLGIPSDCPHLERRGYTGDGQLVCEAAMLTLGAKEFYKKWMEDIADCQDIHSGHIQYTAPYVRSGGGPGGWGCAIAEVPYQYYKIFGDAEPFFKYFDNILNYLRYLDDHSENGLVMSDQEGEWCLGDWCAPQTKHATRPEIPEPFVNTYFYIRTLDRITEMLEAAGKTGLTVAFNAKRDELADVIRKTYFDPSTGDFAGNLNSANAFAVDIRLGDERTLDNLVEKVRTSPLDTGIFGTDLVSKVLFEHGYEADAVEFLSRTEYPSFGHMLANGATTLWEEWKDPRSMSHPMFGSVVKYLFYYVLGIRRLTGSGFGEIEIKPYTDAVTGSTEGYITTENGRIYVSVDRDKNKCTVKCDKSIRVNVVFDGETEIQSL